MADKTITADQFFNLAIDPASIKDREGNVASIQNPSWASSDETIVSLNVSEDGMSADVISHLAGTATVLATVDADLGDGVVNLNGSFSVEVTAGQAATFSLAAGDAQSKA